MNASRCSNLPADLRLRNTRDIPILIISFNRERCLEQLVDWLRAAGQRRIFVIDNASDWPPLLRLLDRLEREGVHILRLAQNHGHRVVWEQDILARLGIDTEYVLTDPDVIPVRACPRDLIGHLHRVLGREPEVHRVGPGICMENIDDAFAHKAVAKSWEQQFWTRPATPGLFVAPIDTTMALYRPGALQKFNELTLRCGWPYLLKHEGFSPAQNDEGSHYAAVARRDTSTWAFAEVPQYVVGHLNSSQAQPRLVHLTRKIAPSWYGWEQRRSGDLTFAGASVDGVYADTLPSTKDWIALRRAIAPNGLVVLRVPFGQLPRLRGKLQLPLYKKRGVPRHWRVTRVLALQMEAVLHLRPAPPGTLPFASVVIEQTARQLDLDTDSLQMCSYS
jgi:hypothetical protein